MKEKLRQSARKYGPYLIFLAAMLWASDAPFRLHLTKDLPSNLIVLGEHFFDTLIALPVLFFNWSELKKLGWKGWLSMAFIAIGGSALASVAFTEAFRYVNPSVAILLQKVQPLIAIALAIALLRERLPKNFFIYAFTAIFGAYIISFPGLIPQTYQGETWNPNTLGVTLALLAAFLWAASTVFGKYVLQKINFQTVTALRFILAFIFLLGLNYWENNFSAIQNITGLDILFIAIIAFVSGIVSLFIYYGGLLYTKASIATLAELGFPLAAVIINYFFIGAALTPVQILGMAILLGALYMLGRGNRANFETQIEKPPEIKQTA